MAFSFVRGWVYSWVSRDHNVIFIRLKAGLIINDRVRINAALCRGSALLHKRLYKMQKGFILTPGQESLIGINIRASMVILYLYVNTA